MSSKQTQNAALRDTYNKIAADWHNDHQTDTWWHESTDAFIRKVRSGGLVLDAGCGSGTKSHYLLSAGLRVVGIDFSEKLIAIAQRKVPDGVFHVLDITNVAALTETFDAIFMQAVLLHIPKQKALQVIEGLAQKLAHGGYFYVAVKEQKPGQPEEEMKVEDDYGYSYERFFSYYQLNEIKGYLEAAGLVVDHENITPSGNTRWIQVIGRKQPA